MANNYLITGYWGEPHVTPENDRGINAAIFGAGRFVLPVGQQFRAEYIGNNTVRMYDGKLLDNGAAAGIPAGKYIDFLIPETGQGMNRNDLIIFEYSQDASTLIESGVFKVVSGVEASGTAADPEIHEEDILSDEATLDQMPLFRVPVSGAVISAPVQLFEVSKSLKDNAGSVIVEATSSNGVAYSATAPGVTELYAGLEITIIPKVVSASTAITLNVNGLGAKMVRLPLSTNTAMLVQPDTETYFVDNRPVKLMYDPEYAGKGAWVAVDKQRQNAQDLYGAVPIKKGGTGADTAAGALKAINSAPGTPNRSMLCYSSLEATGIATSSMTTEQFVIALSLNTSISFTHRKADTIHLTDAPADYGIAIFTEGNASAYVVGEFMDNTGNYYIYSRTNGWQKVGDNEIEVSTGTGTRSTTYTESTDFDCTYSKYGRIVIASFKATMASGANTTWADFEVATGLPKALTQARGIVMLGNAQTVTCAVTTSGAIRIVSRETSVANKIVIGSVVYVSVS